MRERSDVLIGLLVGFLLLFPLGYVVHVSPRFPGSLAGGILGIVAALLMLLTLPYVAAKHIGWVERRLSKRIATPTLLAIHIYAGVLAPLIGLIHAAHTFGSPLGVALTGLILLTVTSGFIGRYLLAQMARALRGRRSELASLKSAFLNLPAPVAGADENTRLPGRWAGYFFAAGDTPSVPVPEDRVALASALSDTEYAVRAEEATNALFGKWRVFHIVCGVLLYAALLLHIGAAIYYGLRWL